jgi:hypothetical protein
MSTWPENCFSAGPRARVGSTTVLTFARAAILPTTSSKRDEIEYRNQCFGDSIHDRRLFGLRFRAM